ncbi:MAG: autotransporter outer membrane beta-barrel domain-containing protein [Xanthobacteraceae bacterium]
MRQQHQLHRQHHQRRHDQPSGIAFVNGTISGFVESTGTIIGGISLDGTSKITSTGDAVEIGGPTFSGGISNAGTIISASIYGIFVNTSTFSGDISNSGTISAAYSSIYVSNVSTFAGGISNSGTISAGYTGIHVANVATFAGVISNSGTISGGAGDGIFVAGVSTFSGGISNSGTISTGGHGIYVATGVQFGSTSAGGGIVNSGTISAGDEGIFAFNISTFAGGISNAGTISAGGSGIEVSKGSTFAGGISNAGTISAGGDGIDISTVSAFSGGISNASGDSITANTGIYVVGVSTFSGGIVNNGRILASNGDGMVVSLTSSFAGGIGNSGTISAGAYGISVVAVSTFSGGISNAGTISAGVYGIDVDTVSTFAGGISNAGTISANIGILIGGGVTFAAGSAIVNSGTIDGANAAINVSVDASPVTIDIDGGAINGKMLATTGNGDVLNFTLGSGTFTYGAAYGFSGFDQVNVNSGTVILDGVNNATAIDVFSGGTLAGTGTLDPLTVTIHSGGAFAPGAPGTPGTSMNITGNLAFQSGALYVVYLGPKTSSYVNVTGAAALAGTVDASFAAGSPAVNRYTILDTTGGLGGTTFSGLTTAGLPSGFDASLSYSADDAFLNLSAALGAGTPLNQNQENVANAINNFFNAGGTLPPAFANLFNLSDGNLANALTQLDGEDATGAERGAFDLMNEFLGLMLDPFVDGRVGSSTNGGALGFAPDQQASLPPDIALAYAGLLKAPPAPTLQQRWSTWASGFGGSAASNGDPATGSTNVTTSTYGYAAGADYHVSTDTVLGFSLAGGGTNWTLANALGTGRSDAFLAGLYGVTHKGPWYLGGALAFANNWFTTNRTALGDQLTANFQGQSYAARLEGGYRFAVPVYRNAVGITPYAALQAQNFHTPSYSETDLTGGGFGLSYNAMNGTDTRSELGARFDDLTALNAMPLILRAKLAWAHDWVSNPALNASFEALPGSSFTVNGAPIPRDSALTSAGAQLFFTPNWSLLAKFDGEFAGGSQLYAGSGTLRYTW